MFNPLLPTGSTVEPHPFSPLFLSERVNQPMCGTNLETSLVVLLDDVSVMRASLLVVERDRGKGHSFGFLDHPKRAPLCGFTIYASRRHYSICSYRAVKTLCIAGSGSHASRVLVEQDQKIKILTHFSI